MSTVTDQPVELPVAQAVRLAMPLAPSIDFEFRSGTDITQGLPNYFADPEATVLCLAWAFDGAGDPGLWAPRRLNSRVAELLDHVRAGGKLRAWNAMFEWFVWNHHMVPVYGWPALPISQLEDSMAEAAAMNLPQSLGKCAAALGLPADKQKDKIGKELIMLLCVPQAEPVVKPAKEYKTIAALKGAQTRHRKWQERGGRWINDPEKLEQLYSYCQQDVVTEVAVSQRIRRLSAYEQRVWEKTQEINLRGVPLDIEEAANITRVVDAETDQLNAELAVLTGGEVSSANERAKLLEWVNSRAPKRQVAISAQDDPGIPPLVVMRDLLEDMQAESIDKVLGDPRLVLPADVRRALEIRSAVSQTSTAKLEAMCRVAAPDGTLKMMIVYHGAGTGRDASRGGVNLQNITRPRLTVDEKRGIDDIAIAHWTLGQGAHDMARLLFGSRVMDAAVACVRGVLKAPKGYIFTDGDFSSVENRVGVWLAGQWDKVEMFAKGLDEYKVFASTNLYNVAYEAVTKDMRQVSKSAVLGCLFGQGAVGLVAYAAGMGVYLTLEDATRIVAAYRKEYRKVRNLWYRCGDAAIEAVENPGRWVRAGHILKLMCLKGFLFMKLPSGRVISWYAPKVEMRKTPWGEMRKSVTVEQQDSVTHQWRRDVLLGSAIYQNGVQATARDLLMHACFNVEDAGYQVVLRAHDELLSCNPIGFGSIDDFIERMCDKPDWAADLPLAGEGWQGPRFKK